MTITSAKQLKKKMPYKQIFYDEINRCYRLINPFDLLYYKDEEGRVHKRKDVQFLFPVVL